MDYGVEVSDSTSASSKEEDETDAANTVTIRKIPIEADFLFAYSTVPGGSFGRLCNRCIARAYQ